jgi:hypothetical protein
MLFAGLFAIACIHLACLSLKYAFAYDFAFLEKICVSPLLYLLGQAIINLRLRTVHLGKMGNLKSPSLLVQYVNMLSSSFANVEHFHSYVHVHKQGCELTECYCTKYCK